MTDKTFTFTMTRPDTGARLGTEIANTMRDAAAVIEMQVPLEHGHMYDAQGLERCQWDAVAVEPAK